MVTLPQLTSQTPNRLSKPLKISVIIPAFERVSALRTCLLALAPGKQRLSPDHYEVIVTDDSSTDAVQEMVRREFPWVRWMSGPRRGPAANRNNGAKSSSGEWIVFTDDDCVPQADWLFAFHSAMQNDAIDLLEGRTLCPDRTNAILEETIENLRGGNFWTCNLAVRRSAFDKLSGFDEDFHEAAQEDSEFNARAQSRGLHSAFVGNALVHHPARRITLRQLWKRAKMIRWFSLYLLKTREGWAETRLPGALISVCFERAGNLLRENRKLLRGWRENGWRRTCFHLCWQTLVFPILLPYVLWWEARFRKWFTVHRTACPKTLQAAVNS